MLLKRVDAAVILATIVTAVLGYVVNYRVNEWNHRHRREEEELELEMIDLGVDEFYAEEDGITVYAPYESFGAIQKWLDDKGFEIVSGESAYLPTDTKELDAEGRESIEKLVERLEEDDDVVNVYHNMKEPEEAE